MNTQLTMFDQFKRSFHKTIELSSEELRAADKAAKRLETKVLNLMLDGVPRSAPEVQRDIEGTPLIGSIRRALTNLTTEPFGRRLIKTKETSPGLYQFRNCRYKLNK